MKKCTWDNENATTTLFGKPSCQYCLLVAAFLALRIISVRRVFN